MKKKSLFTLLISICLLFSVSGCKSQTLSVSNIAISHNESSGGINIQEKIEDFNSKGFELGDSVDLIFSSGQKLEDVPYYNGYYSKKDTPVLVAYPGNDELKAANTFGDDLFTELNLDESTTLTIILNTKDKYDDVQEIMDTVYENDRDKFDSDVVFANYRPLKGGTLKDNLFFRSASPVDNKFNRAAYVDMLAEKDGIKYILNLSDNEDELNEHFSKTDYNSPYAKKLYNEGKVKYIDLGMNYSADVYKKKVAEGFSDLIKHEGPYLIHCVEGKDRTGFVAILIESLCNATYDELKDDFMITYDNYYNINEENAKDKYDAMVENRFNDMVFYLAGVTSVEEIKNVNMQQKAKEYLLSGGMKEEEVNKLIDILNK